MRLISNIAPPSTSPWKSRNPPKWGPRCHPRTRTALAVFLDCDGLLLPELCGLVASRCRPWGSHGSEPVGDNDCSLPAHQTLSRTPSLRSFSLSFWPCTVTRTFLPSTPVPVPLSSFTPRRDESENPLYPFVRPQGVDHCRVRCLTPMLPPLLDPILPWASPTSGSHPRSKVSPVRSSHRSEMCPQCKHCFWRDSLPDPPLAQ